MTPQVYIPSRGRWKDASKTAKIWSDGGFHVTFVVEPNEWDEYDTSIKNSSIDVHELPVNNAGIGNTRNFIVNLAASYGHRAIIMADDDMRPKRKMDNLVECAKHSKILGITARYSYHDLCLGPSIKHRDDLILLPSLTFKLIALNINNALDVGNFDRHFVGLEDNDFALRGLEAGFPWMIHLGTYSTATGPRYAPGGLSAYCANKGIDYEFEVPPWYARAYERWPDIISGHETMRIRFSWKKAYDKFIPGWKDYSALHGGYLARYLGVKHASH